MKIQLTKPLINSPFNDNGSNTFKNIEAIYLKDVNLNIVQSYYHYFQQTFTLQAKKFVSKDLDQQKNQNQETEQTLDASVMNLILFDGSEETIQRAERLIKKVAFKDENFQNPLNDADFNELDFFDKQKIIGEFLVNFWLSKWSLGGKKK